MLGFDPQILRSLDETSLGPTSFWCVLQHPASSAARCTSSCTTSHQQIEVVESAHVGISGCI